MLRDRPTCICDRRTSRLDLTSFLQHLRGPVILLALRVFQKNVLCPPPLKLRPGSRIEICVLLLLLGRVAVVAQRPIVIKLSRGRSVGLCVRASVGRSVQCIVEKRRIGSGCRLAS